MATTVGSVEVEVVARIDKLERDLKKVEKASGKTGKKASKSFMAMDGALKKVGKRLLLVGAGIVSIAGARGFAEMAKSSIAASDTIGKTAAKLGLTTDALQEFRFAADQSGVAAATLDMAVQRFARRAGEAAIGTGEAKDAIKELKISLFDSGKAIRTTEDLFSQAMKTLGDVKNPVDRLRLAFKLFDSEGVAIVNMVNNFEELRETARSMGLVIDESVIRNAEQAKSKLDMLGQAISADLSPVLTAFAAGPLVELSEMLKTAAHWATDFWAGFADAKSLSLNQTRDRINSLSGSILTLQERLKPGSMDLAGPAQHIDGLRAELKKQLAEMEVAQARADSLTTKVKPPASPDPVVLPLTDEQVSNVKDKLAEINKAYLQASGQRIKLIEIEAAAQIESLTEMKGFTNLTEEEKAAARIKINETASLKIVNIRKEEAEKIESQVESAESTYQGLFDYMESGFGDAMADMVLTGEASFKQLGMAFAREFLQKMVTDSLASNAMGLVSQGLGSLSGLIGLGGSNLGVTPTGTGAGGVLPWWRGGGTAEGPLQVSGEFHAGGPMGAGQTGLVGEKGPELFTPSTMGNISSNEDLVRAIKSMRGVDTEVESDSIKSVRRESMRRVDAEVDSDSIKGMSGVDTEVEIDPIAGSGHAHDASGLAGFDSIESIHEVDAAVEIPAFHAGGEMKSGRMALVGEKGPELFVPQGAGRISSNNELARAIRNSGDGGGVTVTVVNASGKESSVNESEGADNKRMIEVMIGDAVSQNITRGGPIDKAIRASYGIKRPGVRGT